MQINAKRINNKIKEPGKLLKIVLFWTNFLFVVFLSKKILSYPKGNIDFLLKNLLSFICAIILTATMVNFLSQRDLKISIPIIWIITILLIV